MKQKLGDSATRCENLQTKFVKAKYFSKNVVCIKRRSYPLLVLDIIAFRTDTHLVIGIVELIGSGANYLVYMSVDWKGIGREEVM